MKICITGAAGFIGEKLADKLEANGAELHLLTRKKMLDAAHRGYFTADLVDGSASLAKLLSGVNVVYHCAGEIKNTALMHDLHVGGTQRLLDAVRVEIETTKKPIHWVQLSSVGAYGPPRGAPQVERVVVESSPSAPVGEYEVTKTLADELVIQFAKTEPLFSYSILRPSIVVGATMPNQSVRALVRMIKKRLFFYIGSRSAVATYIHVDDVVDALILCGERPSGRGQVFNLSNDCALSEIVNAVAVASGLRPPDLCVPERPLRLLVKLLSRIGRAPLTQSRINAMVIRTRYPTTQIEGVLGFKPAHAIPFAIATMFAKS